MLWNISTNGAHLLQRTHGNDVTLALSQTIFTFHRCYLYYTTSTYPQATTLSLPGDRVAFAGGALNIFTVGLPCLYRGIARNLPKHRSGPAGAGMQICAQNSHTINIFFIT
jgi:hypothetical protein